MADLLIAAINIEGGADKGEIVNIFDSPHVWGAKEGLPNFIQLRVSDRTKDQINDYLTPVVKAFNYTIDVQNAQGVRATIAVNQAVSGALDLGIKQEIKDFILAGAGVDIPITLRTQTANSIQVDIELADDENRTPTLLRMRDNINDVGADVIFRRRFHFTEAGVDTVVSLGGSIERTAAQVVQFLVDRMA